MNRYVCVWLWLGHRNITSLKIIFKIFRNQWFSHTQCTTHAHIKNRIEANSDSSNDANDDDNGTHREPNEKKNHVLWIFSSHIWFDLWNIQFYITEYLHWLLFFFMGVRVVWALSLVSGELEDTQTHGIIKRKTEEKVHLIYLQLRYH